MKKIHIWIYVVIIIINITLLSLIWKGLPLWLNEINPLVSTASLILMSIIVIVCSASIIFGMLLNYKKSSENPEIENQDPFKSNLEKQKKLLSFQIEQVIKQLKIAFKFITKNKSRTFRKLPFYLALNGKNSESELFFEKSGIDFLSSANLENIGQWLISNQAVILNVNTKQESFWGIDIESYQWLGILKFLKKFRRFRAINGIIISLNFPQYVIQSESTAADNLKILLKLIKSLDNQFKKNIPVYFIFTHTNAIAGFNEFFSDLNAEERNRAWGIDFSFENLFGTQQYVNYFEKEFNQVIADINIKILIRLETEKEIERRVQICCFAQQIALCKPSLKLLLLQITEVYIHGMYFVGNAVPEKIYNFAMTAMAMRFGLTVNEPVYLTSRHDFFSKKILSDLILKDINTIQTNSYLQKLSHITKQLRWLISIGIIAVGSIGFSVSYAHNSASITAITKILPYYRNSYAKLMSSDDSLQAPLETLNLLNSMQKQFKDTNSLLKIYFLGYEPFQINDRLNNNFQELLSTQFMPRVLFNLEKMLANNTNNPEILYEALKGYLAFSPVAGAHPEWIKPPIQYYINTNYENSPSVNEEINHYLNNAISYPVDSLPLNQPLIEKTRKNLRQIPPALFAYHELKSQSEINQDQFRLDQQIKSDFSAVFRYKDSDKSSIPLLFTLGGFLNLHNTNTKNLILHTADIYQILGLSNQYAGSELATEMNPQVWGYYNQDYSNFWYQYLNNIQIENFDDLNQAIEVLNILTQPHNPLSEVLEKIFDNTATIRDSHMTIAKEFSGLNTFIGLPGKPGAQYKILNKNMIGLRDYLVSLSTSPNVQQAEFQDASAYLQNKMPNNPIGILKRQAQQLPFPLNQWINNIADNSFKLLLVGSHQVINTAWQNAVMPVYQADIQNRFPFGQQSDTYVSLNSFGNFFGNGGIFSQFFNIYLSPFINISNPIWTEYKLGNYSLGLSSEFMIQLKQVDQIQKNYFLNNDKNPSITFSIQPHTLDLQSKSVYVQMANQNFLYRHGPQQTFSWHWPAAGDTQQVSISFNDFSGKTSSTTLDGPWAWFALLNSTQFQAAGAPGHYVWTINQNGHQASFDIWTTNNQDIFNLKALRNLNLPSVI